MALTDKLTAIANAIRAKTGKTAKMTMTEMVTEIGSISGGLDELVDGSIDKYESSKITKISAYKFYYSSLATVSCPEVTSVGNNAFHVCNRLSSVNLPAAINVGNNAFRECSILKSISLPKMFSANSYMFYKCVQLKTVDLGAASSIGTYAFNNCIALTAFVLRNTSKVCSLSNTNAFTSTPIASGTGYIYVPDALVDSYKAATNWSTYAAQIKPLSEYTGG